MGERTGSAGGRARAAIGWAGLGLTLLAALPLGANRPLAGLAFGAAALALLAAMLATRLTAPRERQPASLLLPGLLVLAALGWGLVQTSETATAALGQLAGGVEAVAHPAFAAVERGGTISADPIAGHASLLRLAAFAALFFIAVEAGAKAGRSAAMVRTVGAALALLAAYGLLAHVAGRNPLLGALANGVSASFVNPNSFATYAAFGALANLALVARILDGARRRHALPRFIEAFIAGGFVPVLGFLSCLTALLATQSRGGVLAFAAGALALLAATRPRRAGGAAAGAALVLGLAFAGAIAAGGLAHKVASAVPDARLAVYGKVLSAIGERPLLGHGLGAFEDVFRAHVPPAAAVAEWDKAHDTYLELAFELGLPAAAAFLAALALIAARVVGAAFSKRSLSAAHLAGLGCLVAAALHALVDFSLQIPAVGALFAFLLGLAFAAATPRPAPAPDGPPRCRAEPGDTTPPPVPPPPGRTAPPVWRQPAGGAPRPSPPRPAGPHRLGSGQARRPRRRRRRRDSGDTIAPTMRPASPGFRPVASTVPDPTSRPRPASGVRRGRNRAEAGRTAHPPHPIATDGGTAANVGDRPLQPTRPAVGDGPMNPRRGAGGVSAGNARPAAPAGAMGRYPTKWSGRRIGV